MAEASVPPLTPAGGDQIGYLVTRAAARHPRLTAVKTADGRTITYRELDGRSTQLANALLADGLRPGDRVASWLDTCPEYIELYLAVAKAGLVLVPINSLFTEAEAEHILTDSGARYLFHLASDAERSERISDRYDLIRLIPVEREPRWGSTYETLLRAGSSQLPPPPEAESLYVIAYTSGTTGPPKGAMITHQSLKNNLRHHAHAYRTPLYSVCVYHSNMSFVATVLGLILGHLYLCGTVVLTGPIGPRELIEVLDVERGTFTFVPAPWIRELTEIAAAQPDKWRHVRIFVHTASKADPRHLAAWARVVGHRYFEGWGMTELSGGLLTGTDVDDVVHGSTAKDFYASVGRPVLDTLVRVVDSEGNDLPHDGDTVGELVVQSPALFAGYWRNDAATRAALCDGWFHTGDLGSVDAAGYVYVTERRTDLIVSGGMNVYPSEIEQCIGQLPGVRAVAVVGIRHERWGQTPIAVIVPERGAELTEADVIAHCKVHIARFKAPSRVEFVDGLPMSASNKILRRVLRDTFGEPRDPVETRQL